MSDATQTWGLVPPARLVRLRTHDRPEGAAPRYTSFRPHLRPVAGWRMDCSRFDFDSSFIGPHARSELPDLARLRARFPGSPAAIFGHTDPSGSEGYNKELSGRRALALYALLVRNVEIWEWLYGSARPGDDWGARALQTMLAELVDAEGTPYYAGEIDGNFGDESREALKAFQAASTHEPLKVDGKPGPASRKALFAAYMDRLCVDADGVPFRLVDADFLARGVDPQHRADVQGCGEFNPLMVFSREQKKRYESPSRHEERDLENSVNRRAVVFLYPTDVTIDPALWPCPSARDGSLAACRKRFWSDHEARRGAGEAQRFFDGTADTFGCRFYHYIGWNTPAEAPVTTRPTFDVYVDAGGSRAGEFELATDDGTWWERMDLASAPKLRNANGHEVSCTSFVDLPPGQVFTLSFIPIDAEPTVLFQSFRITDFAEASARFPRDAEKPSRTRADVDPSLFATEGEDGPFDAGDAPEVEGEVVAEYEWEGGRVIVKRVGPADDAEA